MLGPGNRENTEKNSSLSWDQINRLIQIFAREIAHSNTLIQHYPGNANKEMRETVSRTLAAHMAGITIRRKTPGEGAQQLPEEVATGWIYNGQVPAIARYLSRGGAGAKGGQTI